jgi:hypothetical protein
MAAILVHTIKCKIVEKVFMCLLYFMQIVQPVAFNTEEDELLYRLSTEGFRKLQMKVKEQKNTTGINIIFAGNREEKQHNRG